MSFGARWGFFVLLAGLALPALAQEQPGGAWKDPPAHEGSGTDAPKDSGEAGKTADRAESEAASNEASAPEAASRRKVRRSARVERKRSQRVREAASERTTRSGPAQTRMSRRSRAVATARFAPDEEDAYGPPRYPLTQLRREGWGNLISRRRARTLARADAREGIELHGPLFGGRHGYMSAPEPEEDGLSD